MTRLGTLVAAAWMACGSVASAGEAVVVELFTSQGCSSCPPADRFLGELAARDDIIALAYHVDYWDYLGWKDSFASPEHTKRQRAYGHAQHERTIYTPQMVVGGQDLLIGSRKTIVNQSIRKHLASEQPVRVQLKRSGDTVTIQATPRGAARDAVIQIVTFTPKSKVDVKRGENAGKTIAYHNVVNSMRAVANWNGHAVYKGSVKVPAGTSIVVLVQERGTGPILGAAQLR